MPWTLSEPATPVSEQRVSRLTCVREQSMIFTSSCRAALLLKGCEAPQCLACSSGPAGSLVMLKQLTSLYNTALLLDAFRVQNHLIWCRGPAGLFAALEPIDVIVHDCSIVNALEAQIYLIWCSGPAGLFAALELAQAGLPVVLLERGQPVEKRGRDIGALFVRRKLDQDSNLCYGQPLFCCCPMLCITQVILFIVDTVSHAGSLIIPQQCDVGVNVVPV